MYKTILVPHAGTKAGDEALKHAIHIAKSSSSKIFILHIIEEISHPLTFALANSEREKLLSSIREANESIRKDMEKQMQKKIEMCKKQGLQTVIQVVTGNAAEHIINLVKEKGIDLIVMAKRRKLKGVKKLLTLGSVSRKVVENVTCPVLLIDVEKL
ncbi:MAG TPA: universal stress protein [Nitrosopumilaceae archaeon]|nr:universal stress protein [Nitrosopumilaceae archaeon]